MKKKSLLVALATTITFAVMPTAPMTIGAYASEISATDNDAAASDNPDESNEGENQENDLSNDSSTGNTSDSDDAAEDLIGSGESSNEDASEHPTDDEGSTSDHSANADTDPDGPDKNDSDQDTDTTDDLDGQNSQSETQTQEDDTETDDEPLTGHTDSPADDEKDNSLSQDKTPDSDSNAPAVPDGIEGGHSTDAPLNDSNSLSENDPMHPDPSIERQDAPLKDCTVIVQGGEKQYDGTPLESENYFVGLAEGHTVTYETVGGSRTEVGSQQASVDNIRIYDADGNDVTSEYAITVFPGNITIVAGSGSTHQDYYKPQGSISGQGSPDQNDTPEIPDFSDPDDDDDDDSLEPAIVSADEEKHKEEPQTAIITAKTERIADDALENESMNTSELPLPKTGVRRISQYICIAAGICILSIAASLKKEEH